MRRADSGPASGHVGTRESINCFLLLLLSSHISTIDFFHVGAGAINQIPNMRIRQNLTTPNVA